ncbi:Fanconi anemia group I protein isoform X2 [Helianthus annuus]|uniref:Fanconi anemia group I protein isoform X2 n=1 Tax=Helianthus annuus TaxID=4232 RepID=UPI000B8F208C|nr:Fanconi anemia group I protein isoform X2 [Helianthus annuus]
MTTTNHRDTPPSLSPDDIIRLAQYHTTAPLHPFLLSPTSHQTLISHLHTLSPATVSQYTSSLLSLLSPSPSLSSLITPLIISYINLFNSHKIPHDRHSFKTLQLFSSHLDNIPITDLQLVSESIVNGFPQINSDPDEAQLLDLLPKCLHTVFNSDEIDKPRDTVNAVFDRVLEFNWSGVLLVKLVSIIREFQFIDKVRVRRFVAKVFDEMHRVELQDLPLLVYQLLVLASKGVNKREVIEGIIVFFGGKAGLEKGGSTIVREVEGTVLLHVNFAVKQDPSLGQEVLGLVRSDVLVIDHFVVGLLLSIARIRRYGENVMGTLKTALSTSYKDYKFSRHCKWLPDGLKKEYLQNAISTEAAVLRAVNESNYGREHIVPSIVQLGFVLLESVEEMSHQELDNTGLMGSQELGLQMLKSLFEVHDMARNEIIEQCKFRILSLKPEQSVAIVRLLGNLVKNYPHPILEYISHLKELLDYFGFMQSKVVSHLIDVLLPLIKFSHNLQDYIILVVRKAMFRQEDQVRLAAAGAIINLTIAERQFKQNKPCFYQESSSQASSSQVHEGPPVISNDLFKELSGLLQRCLYQQAKVKEVVYRGLLKLVLVDPLTAGEVFDFLLPHFLKFYKEDGQLDIVQCVKTDNGKICVVEPLDDLLSCVSWILLLQPQAKSDVRSDSWASFGFSLTQDTEQAQGTNSGETFSSALSTIRKLLRDGNLEGLVGQTKDAGLTSQQEERYKYSGLILSGVIKVMLNTVATELEKAVDDKKTELENEFSDLVDLYVSSEKNVANSTQSDSTRKGTTQSTAIDPTYKNESDNTKCIKEKAPVLATSSIYQLFKTSFELYKHDATKSKLLNFVLNAILFQIKSFAYVAKDDPLKGLIYGDIKVLGPPLLKLIWLLMKKEAKGKKDNGDIKGLFLLALMCLKELVIVNSHSGEEIREIEEMLLDSVGEDVSDSECDHEYQVNGIDDQREKLLVTKFVKPLFSKLLHAKFFHEVEILCDIAKMIWSNILGSWAIHICKSNNIANPKIAKSVVTLALSCTQAPNDLIVAQEMAMELAKTMISPSEKSEIYAIINRSTESAIATGLLQLVESVIADMDRLSMKLKTCLVGAYKDGKHNPYFTLEETLYQRAEAVVELLSSFVVMNLKDSQAEHLLKLAAKFYKNLARISKFHIAPKGCKQILPSLKCQKLVEVTCTRLTAPLYVFVGSLQQNQKESKASKGLINKIKRENRCIPDLIFQIEDYEKYLILLSKATKINLLRHAKRSTARDFRITEPQNVPQQENGPNQEPLLDPQDITHQEDVPNEEPRMDNDSTPQNDLVQDSDDNAEADALLSPETVAPFAADDAEADVLSPETVTPLAADGSESCSDDENIIRNSKRSRIVYDSDDEA